MNTDKFISKVKEMRKAQKNYFANRWHDVKKREYLTQSKRLEKEVDKMIEDEENPQINIFK